MKRARELGTISRRVLERWLVPLVIACAIAVPAWVTSTVNSRLLEVTCQSALSNRQQLWALRQVAEELGLPGEFEIEPLPEECES